MKRSFKVSALCLFAALGLMIQGCGPEAKITGLVLDDQTGTAVPGTAVLGMVWIEDADKALPKPDTKNLKSEDRDTALDKDTNARGLPAAYARNFTDSNGRFELGNFHFSAATKKAVKAMKQPRITRVTMWAFQKGYRKQALTMFPKNHNKEIPAATILLAKPVDWKELYVDNIVDTLTQDYMLKGYSKEFGATKAEKSWIFEYTRANEQRAYDTSDIKNDKKMEEMCGRDYSDIIVSSAGIQRNPEREKCGELLKRIGAIREVEELWLAHSNMKQDPLAAAKEVVSQALNALSSETAEPKEYEAAILAGLEAAGKTQSKDAMRNGLGDNVWQDEAKLLYGQGDKAAAYRELGYALYNQLPKEIEEGVVTAQLPLRIIPGIKESAAGFYLLMNRPLTAQLPNGDNGNHKDKPGYKVEAATETADKVSSVNRSTFQNGNGAPKKIRLGDDEIDVEKLQSQYYMGVELSSDTRRETFEDHEAKREIYKKAYGQPNAGYFVKVENHLVEPECENCEDYDEVKSKLELYSSDGTMRLQKDFDNTRILRAAVIKNGVFLVDVEPFETQVNRKQEIYDADGKLLYESQNIINFFSSPQADYLLFIEKDGVGSKIEKVDSNGNIKVISKLPEDLYDSYISDDGGSFIISGQRRIGKKAPSGRKYMQKKIFFFKNLKLIWDTTLEAEAFFATYLSKSSKFVIICYDTDYKCKTMVSDGEAFATCNKWLERFEVLDTATRRIIYDGLKDEKLILEYINETVKK